MYIHFVYLFVCCWTQVAFTFWLLWVMLLWTWVYKYLFKSLLSFLMVIYPEMEVLGHMAPDLFTLTLLLWCPMPVCIPVFEGFINHTPDLFSVSQINMLMHLFKEGRWGPFPQPAQSPPALSHCNDSPGRSTHHPTGSSGDQESCCGPVYLRWENPFC